MLPQKKGVAATAANIESVASQKTALKAKEQERLAAAQARADQAKILVLTLACRASDEGKLFGAVSSAKIVALLAAQNVEVKLQEVIMPKEQVRYVGEHHVALSFHPDVLCEVPLQVVAEGS